MHSGTGFWRGWAGGVLLAVAMAAGTVTAWGADKVHYEVTIPSSSTGDTEFSGDEDNNVFGDALGNAVNEIQNNVLVNAANPYDATVRLDILSDLEAQAGSDRYHSGWHLFGGTDPDDYDPTNSFKSVTINGGQHTLSGNGSNTLLRIVHVANTIDINSLTLKDGIFLDDGTAATAGGEFGGAGLMLGGNGIGEVEHFAPNTIKVSNVLLEQNKITVTSTATSNRQNAYGAGVSYGYRWNFNHRWGLEATIGAGYIYKDYEVFECRTCGDFIAREKKHYFGPTKIGLSLVYSIGSKKVIKAPPVVPVVTAPPVPYEPNLSTSYVIPDVESPKVRSQSYTAYIDFEQGRSEIIGNLRNNASELRRINDITRNISTDKSSTISHVTITGYASPEDTYERNMALSERRTQAVSDYVSDTYNLDPAIFRVSSRGEDWTTLDSLVAASTTIPEKHRVLEIIRSGGDAHADAVHRARRDGERRTEADALDERRVFVDDAVFNNLERVHVSCLP